MKFFHIAPSNYLRHVKPSELLLAHLVESDETYRDYYSGKAEWDRTLEWQSSHPGISLRDREAKWYAPGPAEFSGRILDNSAFELYRAGLPMFDGSKMIELGDIVGAEYLVLPDYPAEAPMKTISAAYTFAPQFKEAGFKTFFVPQGRNGNLDDYFCAFAWAAQSPLVDYIGVSIIAGPTAFGADSHDNIQTFLSRYELTKLLFDRGLIQLAQLNNKKIHFLGMTDGPKEILMMANLPKFIDTWDSSAAAWAGIEGIAFDHSPTGLAKGKVKSHVDFSIVFDQSKTSLMRSNMKVIDEYVKIYNETAK